MKAADHIRRAIELAPDSEAYQHNLTKVLALQAGDAEQGGKTVAAKFFKRRY